MSACYNEFLLTIRFEMTYYSCHEYLLNLGLSLTQIYNKKKVWNAKTVTTQIYIGLCLLEKLILNYLK